MTLLLILFALVSAADRLQSAHAQSATGTRTYNVSTIGSVEMSVPAHWEEIVRLLEVPPGVTLAYRSPSKNDFYMKVTSAWEPQQERSSRDPGWLRRVVENSARNLGEKNPRLTDIQGPSARGYYFQLAHKETLPIGEFNYLVVGVADLGKITLVFTAYSTVKDMPEIGDALRVIESAHFVEAK